MEYAEKQDARDRINAVQDRLGRLFGEGTPSEQIDNEDARDLMQEAQRLLDKAYSAI